MDIIACGSRPSRRMGPPSFTGTVWQDPIIQAPDPARIRSAWVRFEPGARTAWHTHPLGQTLFVTSGIGRVQTWGGPIREIRAGDTVYFRLVKNTGTERPPTTRSNILPCKKPKAASTSPGSSR